MCQGSIQYYIDLHCPIMSHLVKGSHVQPDLSIRTGPLGKFRSAASWSFICSAVSLSLACRVGNVIEKKMWEKRMPYHFITEPL